MATKRFESWDVYVDEPANGDPDQTRYSFQSAVEGGVVHLNHDLRHQPAEIRCGAWATGIKHEGVLDFTVVRLDRAGAVGAIYTKNRCPGSAVAFDKANSGRGQAQLLAVISKNANVFTPTGDEDVRKLAEMLSHEFQVPPDLMLISCTGVIGVPLPMERIAAAIPGMCRETRRNHLDAAANAILTTDRGPKTCSARFGDAVLCGMAKGAGMLEPNMATMLVYFFTNLAVPAAALHSILTRVAGPTFNSISVDTDTSTSDTVAVFSSETAPCTDAYLRDFENALACLSLRLAHSIVYQGEGATKLIEVTARADGSYEQSRRIAKKVVNSPLVKTAVAGGDPNWGRIVMAIGKPEPGEPDTPIDPRDVSIHILRQPVFERGRLVQRDLTSLGREMAERKKVELEVTIGQGLHSATVWGCDLTEEYVKINASYTT